MSDPLVPAVPLVPISPLAGPSDLPARNQALDPQQSFIVQAPAGSGKTGLLVYRMLSLLARVEKPEQVLAITFTRKATSEMRQRLLYLLSKAESGQKSADKFEQQGIDLAQQVLKQSELLQWNLLDSPQQLQILTIDAFCAKLTGDMPWLSRLGDKPRTTDNAQQHYAAAIEQLLSQLLAEPSQVTAALKTVLLELDYDYNRARRLFGSMLAKRDQWLRHLLQNDLQQLRPALESAWQEIVTEHLALLHQLLPDDLLQRLMEIAQQASAFHQEADSALRIFADQLPDRHLSLEHWQGLQFLLTTKGAAGFRKAVDKRCGFPPTEKELKQKMLGVLEEATGDDELLAALQQLGVLPNPHYAESDWQQIIALETVLKALAAHLQLRFRAVGECDHSEVSQRANLALEELNGPTDLALRMDNQLQHILVDEFQDTSYSQLQLLKKLTAGWQADGSQSLFLVGDPMQSIYRFREADVSLFLQVANNHNTQVFENLQIVPLLLSENFRSGAPLVDWFNETFSRSFPARDQVLTGAISYAAATSNKPLDANVRYLLGEDLQQEAKLVVAAIQQGLASLPEQAQIAVLVRSRTHLKHLLPEIREAGIAYAGVDIQPLKETPAVLDVVALCKAICRLDDRVAWLALLRGPWCGLTLAEIKLLAGQAGLPIWQQLNSSSHKESLAPATAARLARFCEVMQHALQQRQQVQLHSVSRWAWTALGGNQTLFGAQLDDVLAVFDLIEKLQRGGDLPSKSELDNAVEKLYAKPAQAQNPQVVISTIHKSKGLQYHTVILPSLSSKSQSDEKELLMWAEVSNAAAQARLLMAPISLQSQPASHFEYLRDLEKKRSNNETMRLMYVACTRAEQNIVLTGRASLDRKTEQIKAPTSTSLLATIWPVVAERFELAQSEEQQQSDIAKALPQTLQRLPADFKVHYPAGVQWQAQQQLLTQDKPELPDSDAGQVEYQWATEVATAVGIIMHGWLQYNGAKVRSAKIDTAQTNLWRAQLHELHVPAERLSWALKRLSGAVSSMQTDQYADFIFADYPLQQNEYSVSAIENGSVNTYRLDRTFVDHHDVRWIIDYKTTITNADDVDHFVDQQVAERHRAQLEKYGQLMRQLDKRAIRLAVYFPMLGKLRSWDYTGST